MGARWACGCPQMSLVLPSFAKLERCHSLRIRLIQAVVGSEPAPLPPAPPALVTAGAGDAQLDPACPQLQGEPVPLPRTVMAGRRGADPGRRVGPPAQPGTGP